MSPAITEAVDALAKRIRSPLLVFVLMLNLLMLGFIYLGVSDRRTKDHEIMQSVIKECVDRLRQR